MSDKKIVDLKQDRRQWLKTSATILGAAVLPVVPTADAKVLAGAPRPQAAPPASGAHSTSAEQTKTAGRFFTPAQHALVEELSETIIPADSHSGGAKAAKVADYIDRVLLVSVDEARQARWREGLHLIDLMSLHYNGKSFVEASPEQRIAMLQVLSDNVTADDVPEVQLFIDLKRLTVHGYYTSKIGIHDDLEYKGNRILMEFVGCDDPTPPTT